MPIGNLNAINPLAPIPLSDKTVTWEQVAQLTSETKLKTDSDEARRNGCTNAHSRLRLFGEEREQVRVVLFRDHHAWCPYCQKVWLYLEEARIPYEIRKVTMFCYGEKEQWYRELCPRGMLPAIQLDGRLLTESDDILAELEETFDIKIGGMTMFDEEVIECRKLERYLFRTWCDFLCRSGSQNPRDEERTKEGFVQMLKLVEVQISKTDSPWMLKDFSIADIVFVPYLERMVASIYYYKNYSIRAEHPLIDNWFSALEKTESYRGGQSDWHTHSHSLPPQMGSCFWSQGLQEREQNLIRSGGNNDTKDNDNYSGAYRIDEGPYLASDGPGKIKSALPDLGHAKPIMLTMPHEISAKKLEAAYRVLKHRKACMAVNPYGPVACESVLRLALTIMLSDEEFISVSNDALMESLSKDKTFLSDENRERLRTVNADEAARYLRDRCNIPRDMTIWAGKYMRESLEIVARLINGRERRGPKISIENRRDQNPVPFVGEKRRRSEY